MNERIAKSISRMTCSLTYELSVCSINVVMWVHPSDFNQNFKEHMIRIRMTGKSLTLNSSLPLKHDLLRGHHNGVNSRARKLLGRQLEEVELFSFENLRTLKVKVFQLVR